MDNATLNDLKADIIDLHALAIEIKDGHVSLVNAHDHLYAIASRITDIHTKLRKEYDDA